MEKKIRLGIIGIGNMGSGHACRVADGECPDFELTAVADINPARRDWAAERLGKDVAFFDSAEAMLDSGLIDACIVATPHYAHPGLAIECMKRSIHVMVEKPAGVYTKQVREMNEMADRHPEVVFGLMFNQRTNCVYRKMRELVQSGKYGRIRRTNWIITDWYRTQRYYDSGSWRATWKGEGGGVLLNQCPHQLDLLIWLCGMPNAVTAECREGKWHRIEVEDDVTAALEFPNGAMGVFVASTGDLPGTNRLEIDCERGKIVCEDGAVRVWRMGVNEREICFESDDPWYREEVAPETLATDGENPQHAGVINAFAAHLLRGEPLIAEAEDGLRALELSNAIHLSGWTGKRVEIPADREAFNRELEKRIATSQIRGGDDITYDTDHSCSGSRKK